MKDLEQVRDRELKERVRKVIERLEGADMLQEVEGVKRLQSGEGYYRIRIGNHRLGLVWEGEKVVLVRFLHRKDIYRYFP